MAVRTTKYTCVEMLAMFEKYHLFNLLRYFDHYLVSNVRACVYFSRKVLNPKSELFLLP